MHDCACCGNRWKVDGVCANPIADLCPSLIKLGAVIVETQRKWKLLSAAKFAHEIHNDIVHLAFVEQVGDLHFTHQSVHGGLAREYESEGSKELLSELEASFPDMFAEP